NRSDEAGHCAFGEKQASNPAARGPKRSEDPDLGAALRDSDRKRVVDDEHADEHREETRDVHHHRIGRNHRFELLPSASRWIDLKPGSEHFAELHLALGNRAPWLHGHVDPIELAAAAEQLLDGVYVHDREVAAERARQAGRLY